MLPHCNSISFIASVFNEWETHIPMLFTNEGFRLVGESYRLMIQRKFYVGEVKDRRESVCVAMSCECEVERERERDVGIICVKIYDDLALEAWTQREDVCV